MREVPGFSPGHISNVENGHAAATERFIETYARLYGGGVELRALYEQMRRVSDRRKSQGVVDRLGHALEVTAPQTLAQVECSGDVTNHYVTEVHEAEVTFAPSGAISDFIVTVHLRARSSGVRLYYCGAFYDAERRRGVLQATALDGLTLIQQQEDEAGAIKAYFTTDYALYPEDKQAYRASYAVRVNSEQQARPQLAYYSRPGTVSIKLQARFHPQAQPKRLWRFAAANILNAGRAPADELLSDESHAYTQDFEAPVPGWCYGFSWIW